MPALKAARTAFNFPCVNGRTTSTRRDSEIAHTLFLSDTARQY